jgi:hypothetical protein
MRPRLIVDLPRHDPDVALIVAWLRRVPARRRSQAIRRLLAFGVRWVLRQPGEGSLGQAQSIVSPAGDRPGRDTAAGRPAARVHAESAARRRVPASPTTERVTAVAQRFRIPLLTGGLRYDHTEHRDGAS